jgi:hypothetical protein
MVSVRALLRHLTASTGFSKVVVSFDVRPLGSDTPHDDMHATTLSPRASAGVGVAAGLCGALGLAAVVLCVYRRGCCVGGRGRRRGVRHCECKEENGQVVAPSPVPSF